MNIPSYIIAILSLLLFSACTVATQSNYGNDEVRGTVMEEGEIVSMNNPNCLSLSIRAGKGLRRYYTWNGGTRTAVLIPRKSKWYGAYGAYFPGTDHNWIEHDGVTRLIANEAIVDFSDYDQIRCVISEENDACRDKFYKYKDGKLDLKNTMRSAFYPDSCSAYTSDGEYLSVRKVKGPGRGATLYVDLFKIYLNGIPVRNLPRSSDARITVTDQE